jgi:hypothetical protein
VHRKHRNSRNRFLPRGNRAPVAREVMQSGDSHIQVTASPGDVGCAVAS